MWEFITFQGFEQGILCYQYVCVKPSAYLDLIMQQQVRMRYQQNPIWVAFGGQIITSDLNVFVSALVVTAESSVRRRIMLDLAIESNLERKPQDY